MAPRITPIAGIRDGAGAASRGPRNTFIRRRHPPHADTADSCDIDRTAAAGDPPIDRSVAVATSSCRARPNRGARRAGGSIARDPHALPRVPWWRPQRRRLRERRPGAGYRRCSGCDRSQAAVRRVQPAARCRRRGARSAGGLDMALVGLVGRPRASSLRVATDSAVSVGRGALWDARAQPARPRAGPHRCGRRDPDRVRRRARDALLPGRLQRRADRQRAPAFVPDQLLELARRVRRDRPGASPAPRLQPALAPGDSGRGGRRRPDRRHHRLLHLLARRAWSDCRRRRHVHRARPLPRHGRRCAGHTARRGPGPRTGLLRRSARHVGEHQRGRRRPGPQAGGVAGARGDPGSRPADRPCSARQTR